jgi:iron complex outermembrane receptor protein
MILNQSFGCFKSAVLALLFGSTYLFAQSAKDTVANELNEVQIRSFGSSSLVTNIPMSLSSINKTDVQGAQATISLEESLRRIPGVLVNNRNNFSQGDRISIRGIGSRSQFGVRGIKIVQDGIPMTFPDGQSQLNNLDLSYIGKIDVLRGPNAVGYGNASGGVITLESQKPASEGLLLTPKAIFGSYGLSKYQLRVEGTLKKWDYLVQASRTQSTGFRDFSQSLFYTGNAVVHFRPDANNTFTFIANGNDSPYMLNPGAVNKAQSQDSANLSRKSNKLQGTGKIIQQIQAGISYTVSLKNQQYFETALYGIERQLYNPIFGRPSGRVVDVGRLSAGSKTTYRKDFNIGNGVLGWTSGLDLETQLDKRKESQNLGITESQLNLSLGDIISSVKKGAVLTNQDEQISSAGLFTHFSWNIEDKYIITAGGRYDVYSFRVTNHLSDTTGTSGNTVLDQFNPSVGFLYKHSKLLNPYINFSTAFQTPTANEFGNLPSGATGFNKDLKPEKLWNLEAGIRGQIESRKISYELTGYYINIRDQLISYQAASGITYYRNAAKTKNTGIEASLNWNFWKPFTLSVAYSYMQYQFINYVLSNIQLAGNYVPGVPASHFFGGLKYAHPIGFKAEINVQWISGYYANDMNGPASGSIIVRSQFYNDAYTTADFRVSFDRKFKSFAFTVFAGLNNIFNTRYNGSVVPNAVSNFFFEPAMGRNFYVGLEVPLVVKN